MDANSRKQIDRVFVVEAHRRDLRELFAAEGFEVSFARDGAKHGFYAFLKWRGKAANPFGGPLETLLFVVEGGETQHRDIQEAQRIIDDWDGRLNPLVAVVFGPSKNTSDICRLASERSTTHFIGVSLAEIHGLADHSETGVIGWIRTALYDQDLYSNSSAVSSTVNFYGRRSDVTRLATSLRAGGSHFGLFGLRKVGKTSLLLRVLNVLKNEGRSGQIVAHVDAEYADGLNPSTDYLLWQIGDSLFSANKAVRRLAERLDLFGRFNAFYRIPDGLPIREAFAHDLAEVISYAANKTLIIAIDEVQFMASEAWGNSYVQFWRLLRAIDQENSGRLSFIVSGTNPSVVEAGHVGDQENPTFRYINRFPVPPLNHEEGQALLSGLGHQMGLEWEQKALQFANLVTGGHPGLLREFGSQVHARLAPRTTQQTVDLSLTEEVTRHFVSISDPILQELDEHLKSFHPDQHVVIDALAENRLFEWEDYKASFPEEIQVLREYGLIRTNRHGHDDIAIQAYKAWLQDSGRTSGGRNLPDNVRDLDVGAEVGRWELVRPLGRPGGYGRVFEAVDGDGQRVALKVVAGDTSLRLRREVDALSGCDHSGVVKFLSAGSTGSGLAYIAMELLDGESWETYCTPLSKRDDEFVCRSAISLLECLSAIHPNPVSDDVTNDMNVIVAGTRGIIHRDIKPENVVQVPGRGPVLIDFNIASEALERVGTTSATPGYLPPDLSFGGSWGPLVDLYMLGLTLGQIATGMVIGPGRVGDLKEAVLRECSADLADFLLCLCADRGDHRYQSAREALARAEAVQTSLSPEREG